MPQYLAALRDVYKRQMQQRTEILKMLYRENEILIFDEPTAVLTPQEIDELMAICLLYTSRCV